MFDFTKEEVALLKAFSPHVTSWRDMIHFQQNFMLIRERGLRGTDQTNVCCTKCSCTDRMNSQIIKSATELAFTVRNLELDFIRAKREFEENQQQPDLHPADEVIESLIKQSDSIFLIAESLKYFLDNSSMIFAD